MPKAREFFTGDVPFDKSGNMMDYCDGHWSKPDDMRTVVPFKASMELDTWTKGRSAVRVWVRDVKTRVKYPMFMTDFWDVIKDYDIHGGVIGTVKWVVCKKGANYGIKEYKP
jgi:hypothetical protein